MDRHLTKAMVTEGWAICPRCRKKLARVYYGASCHGVELFCKRCELPVILELLNAKQDLFYESQTKYTARGGARGAGEAHWRLRVGSDKET